MPLKLVKVGDCWINPDAVAAVVPADEIQEPIECRIDFLHAGRHACVYVKCTADEAAAALMAGNDDGPVEHPNPQGERVATRDCPTCEGTGTLSLWNGMQPKIVCQRCCGTGKL